MISASAAARGARHAEYGMVVLAVFGCVVGVLIGKMYFHTRYVTQTRVTHLSVQQQYGKPDQTVADTQLNWAQVPLKCDVYSSRETVICHP